MASSKDAEATAHLLDWVIEPSTSGGTAIFHQPTGCRHFYTHASSLIRGVPHPPFIQESIWEAQRQQLVFRANDVFISAFSKCGTTLAEQIVLLLLNGGKTEELNPLHKNTLDFKQIAAGNAKSCTKTVGKIWTEMAVIEGLVTSSGSKTTKLNGAEMVTGEDNARMSPADFDSLPSPRILKTHASQSLFLDTHQTAKVIYVTRNPFDACVSCYYHPKPGVSPESTGMPFEAFCKLWLSERVEFGGWIDHVKGWRDKYLKDSSSSCCKGDEAPEEKQMLWIAYEDLVERPIESIAKMATFLDIANNDPELIQRVTDGCNFENVKSAARSLMKKGMKGDISHLRKGKIGDWRSHFSEELFEEFSAEIQKQFEGNYNYGDLEYDIGGGQKWKPADVEADDSSIKVDDVHVPSPSVSIDTVRLQDIHILGGTMIFYSILQMLGQYFYEFHVDNLQAQNGLAAPMNFPAIVHVLAAVFNGINGGLALATGYFCGNLICTTWHSKVVKAFFVSIWFEAVVTAGAIHGVTHALFGTTLDGNGMVEFIAHMAYSVNALLTAGLTISWLAPYYLRSIDGSPAWYPRLYELVLAVVVSILAVFLTQSWMPYTPDPDDYDYQKEHQYDASTIILLQRNIQGVFESLLLIPTVMALFIIHRLWRSIQSTIAHDSQMKLSFETYRICIIASVVSLCTNWIHFRCHDALASTLQRATGLDHRNFLAAIVVLFHAPNWTLSIIRTHYFRRMTEQQAKWPSHDILETICPGREFFPFAMVFLYRATEGMTISLLPSFYQGGTKNEYFYLDLENTWIAATVCVMFLANTIGAVTFGWLMQKKGYQFTYICLCILFMVAYALFMIPQSNASFLALNSITALLFPGPVILSKITLNTRHEFVGVFKYVPMLTGLIWFNQGFWFGSIISNSSVWTDWNVFFTSAATFFTLFAGLFIAFLLKMNRSTKKATRDANIEVPDLEASHYENENIVKGEGLIGTSDHADQDATLQNDELRENDQAPGPKRTLLLLTRFASIASFASESSFAYCNLVEGNDLLETSDKIVAVAAVDCKAALQEDESKENDQQLAPKQERTLLLARFVSFANGASFACHIGLLPIQVTQLFDLDVYEYTTIVGSLGSMSTILLLLSFQSMASRDTKISMAYAYTGHLLGTAVMCIPQLYTTTFGIAVSCIVISYGVIWLSFFVINLTCEVSLAQKSLKQGNGNDAAKGLQMGIIQSCLNAGKVCGAALVVLTYSIHPQAPLWILEGLLITGASLFLYIF